MSLITAFLPLQEEVDRHRDRLRERGGAEILCGWLKDRRVMRGQVTPRIPLDLIRDPDTDRAGRAMQAMMPMKKIVIADRVAAADGH